MYVILGATGHVGSATAKALLKQGETVTVITRDAGKAVDLKRLGATIVEANVHDVNSLRSAFRLGKRLFLLNPPAAPSSDTDAEERKTVASILKALDGSGAEKVVAESTYGARRGNRIGDLGVLYEFEQGLKAQPVSVSIVRAAYYMSNWDMALDTARKDGIVQTFFPGDFRLPMVAPTDLGQVAAKLLMDPVDLAGMQYVEGPGRYSSNDVAEAFSTALGTPVTAVSVPREKWQETFVSLGFSRAAAESYAGMTGVALDAEPPPAEQTISGSITLQEYVSKLVGDT